MDGLTKEVCIALYLYVKQVVRLGRQSGWLFVALYLKEAASALQIAYGGVSPLGRDLLPVLFLSL